MTDYRRAPAELDDRLRGYVGEVFDCSPDGITALRRIEAGERHIVYRVSCGDEEADRTDLIVRISTGDDPAERTQAAQEAAVLRRVGGVVGPELYDFQLDSHWFDAPVMCLEFLPGQHRDLTSATAADLKLLGAVVRRLHDAPVGDLAAWFPDGRDLSAYVEGRAKVEHAKLGSIRDPLPGPVQHRLQGALLVMNESLDRLRGLCASAPDKELVLLHGDIARGNVLWDAQPVLIDWEYARLGDPADEIAYTFTQNALIGPQVNAFWHGYGNSSDDQVGASPLVERVRRWAPVTLMGSVLWWVDQWSRSDHAGATGLVDPSAPKTPDYYLDQVLLRLDRFEDTFGSG